VEGGFALPEIAAAAMTVRTRMADTLIGVAIRAGGGIALAVLSAAALTWRVDLLAFGLLVAALAGIAVFQRLGGRSELAVFLVVASSGLAVVIPLVDRAVGLVVYPAFTMLIVIGVLMLTKKWAARFAVWNGFLAAVSLRWLIPEPTVMETFIAAMLLGGVGWVAWRLVSTASDLMISEQHSHRLLFDSSPVATLNEDFSAVASALGELRNEGIIDLTGYLRERPNEVRELISLIKIRRANPAAVRMIGAESE
jgi:hypothetical protein